jgi:hypothetical protein
MIVILTDNYLSQPPAPLFRQAKREITITPERITPATPDYDRLIESEVRHATFLMNQEIFGPDEKRPESPIKPIPVAAAPVREHIDRLYLILDRPLYVAWKIMLKLAGEIIDTITKDAATVKTAGTLLVTMPEQRAWNMIITFHAVTFDTILGYTEDDTEVTESGLWVGALTKVEKEEFHGLFVLFSEDVLLRGKIIPYQSIAAARNNLENDKKSEIDEALKFKTDRLLPEGVIQAIAHLKRGSADIINMGITLAFPDYRKLIANIAGISIPVEVRAIGLAPVLIAGGLFAFFALLPRVFK